jgi:MerR family copper efflux transcriptional regulator
MKRTLEHLVRNCHGDRRPDCPILDDLAQAPEHDIQKEDR